MSRLAYDALGFVATLVAAPALPMLALTRYGAGLGERLGELPPEVRRISGCRAIWVHAASVGEVHAAAPLIQALHTSRPQQPILLSTTSLTGRETARNLPGVAAVMLLPLDLRWVVRSVLGEILPSILLVMETEIWPALLHSAADAGVPVIVVSGRVSERAAQRYALVRPLVRDTLRRVTAFGMQTKIDADRVISLGALPERVRVTGSLKYARLGPSQAPDALCPLLGMDDRLLLIAASTQPGEEEVVLEACRGLWPVYPACLLVLAPRRPERFEAVDELLRRAGVVRERRSQLQGGRVEADTQVVLLDSVGELPELLGTARGVFVGGTIAPLGGHNVLEPAALAKPVCFGPHTENVAEAAAALVAGGGAEVVRDADGLRALWQGWLADPEVAREIGMRALEVVRARSSVISDTVSLIDAVL